MVDFPSPATALVTRRVRGAGLPEERLLDLRSDDRLVVPRVRHLLLDRMAVQAGNRYRLTRKGRVLARTFVFYRRLLGAGKGG